MFFGHAPNSVIPKAGTHPPRDGFRRGYPYLDSYGSRPSPIGANLRRKLPLRPRSCAGEGGAKRRMRAATRSGAVVPLASPSRFRAPALIRPSGTFSKPAVGRRGNMARPVLNLVPMGFRRDDGNWANR